MMWVFTLYIFTTTMVLLLGYGQCRPRPQPLDTCDWTVWDNSHKEDKGVKNVFVGCSEGQVDWRHPYGAVRVSLMPDGAGQPFQACFRAKSHSVSVKISLEHDDTYSSLQPLVLLNKTHEQMLREICLESTGEAVTLYLEAGSDLEAELVGHVELDYDILRKYATRAGPDDTEECRPCTEEEVLEAVCSSDFVARGSINEVHHSPEAGESELHLVVRDVIRQKHPIFKQNTGSGTSSSRTFYDIPNEISIHTSVLDTRLSVSANHNTDVLPSSLSSGSSSPEVLSGHIIAPHKCRVRKGEGEFLFIGRIRLKRGQLNCAPRWEDFSELWQRAVQQGTNLCTLD